MKKIDYLVYLSQELMTQDLALINSNYSFPKEKTIMWDSGFYSPVIQKWLIVKPPAEGSHNKTYEQVMSNVNLYEGVESYFKEELLLEESE